MCVPEMDTCAGMVTDVGSIVAVAAAAVHCAVVVVAVTTAVALGVDATAVPAAAATAAAAAAAANSDPAAWGEIAGGKALDQQCGSRPVAR